MQAEDLKKIHETLECLKVSLENEGIWELEEYSNEALALVQSYIDKKNQKEWFVVRHKKDGKFADGFYGWDAAINDLHQVFCEDDLPYRPNDRMEFFPVGLGEHKPNLDLVQERVEKALKKYW